MNWLTSFFSSPKSEDEAPEGAAEKKKHTKAVDLNDHGALKRHLDEVAVEIISSRGYEENHFTTNVKLALGLFTCAVAIFAQLFPQKFPDNKPVLFACIAVYLCGVGAIQLFSTLFEKNFFLITHPQTGTFTQPGLAVTSRLPRFSDEYTIRVESSDPHSIAARPPVELTKSVTKWFTSDGYLAEDLFLEDIQKLLNEYEDDARKTK